MASKVLLLRKEKEYKKTIQKLADDRRKENICKEKRKRQRRSEISGKNNVTHWMHRLSFPTVLNFMTHMGYPVSSMLRFYTKVNMIDHLVSEKSIDALHKAKLGFVELHGNEVEIRQDYEEMQAEGCVFAENHTNFEKLCSFARHFFCECLNTITCFENGTVMRKHTLVIDNWVNYSDGSCFNVFRVRENNHFKVIRDRLFTSITSTGDFRQHSYLKTIDNKKYTIDLRDWVYLYRNAMWTMLLILKRRSKLGTFATPFMKEVATYLM